MSTFKQPFIAPLSDELRLIHKDYQDVLKKGCLQSAKKYIEALHVYLLIYADSAHILDWIITTTIANGRVLAVPLLELIDITFGRQYFANNVYITLTAFIGNFVVFKFLWERFGVAPHHLTLQVVIRRGHIGIADYMLQNQVRGTPPKVQQSIAVQMFGTVQ